MKPARLSAPPDRTSETQGEKKGIFEEWQFVQSGKERELRRNC